MLGVVVWKEHGPNVQLVHNILINNSIVVLLIEESPCNVDTARKVEFSIGKIQWKLEILQVLASFSEF